MVTALALVTALLATLPVAAKAPAQPAAKTSTRTVGKAPVHGPAQADTNLFRSVTAGFRIAKPASWHFLTAQQVADNRAVARLKDEEMDKLIRERASAPLVAIGRHQEPYDALNPTIQVIFRPAGDLAGKPPTALLEFVLSTLKSAMADFELVGSVDSVQVGGRPAASARARYTLKNPAGEAFPVLARMWVVPRGKFLFLVGMSGPPEGPELSEEEFAQALSSIAIDD
jgi:hypothetical protein